MNPTGKEIIYCYGYLLMFVADKQVDNCFLGDLKYSRVKRLQLEMTKSGLYDDNYYADLLDLSYSEECHSACEEKGCLPSWGLLVLVLTLGKRFNCSLNL